MVRALNRLKFTGSTSLIFFFFLHGSAIDAVGDNYDEVTVHGWHPDTL